MLKGRVVGILGLLTLLSATPCWSQQPTVDRFFDADGVRIHYIEAGSGEPIVLMHGNTSSVEQWLGAGVFYDLARDFRVIAFDSRGHGKSEKPHEASAYGDQVALDIARLLDHLDIDRAHILGYSMGARISGSLLMSQPERYLTAIFGGFAPKWGWTAADQTRLDERVARTLSNERLAERGQDPRALAMNTLGFSELAVTDRALAAVTVPTLGIVGSEDPNIDRLRELQGLLPDLELVVIEGATHSGATGAFRRPEFVQALRSFITANSAGR